MYLIPTNTVGLSLAKPLRRRGFVDKLHSAYPLVLKQMGEAQHIHQTVVFGSMFED